MLTQSHLSSCVCWAFIFTYGPPAISEDKVTARDLFYEADTPASKRTPNDATDGRRMVSTTATAGIVRGDAPARHSLGMRYGLLLRQEDGQFIGVDPNKSVFHAGDQVRIFVQTNQDAYVNIIQHGSSGKWSLLFPSPATENTPKLVPAFRLVEVPGTGNQGFTFDDQPGEDRLAVIVSTKLLDVERLVASLGSPAKPDGENLVASATVTRATPRNSGGNSRDLIFETVEEDEPGAARGVIRYAINPLSSPDSELVVNLDLRHAKRGDK
jgi:hypothetical protein